MSARRGQIRRWVRRATAALAVATVGALGSAVLTAAPVSAATGGTIVGVQQGVGVFTMSADGAGEHLVVPSAQALAVAAAPGSNYMAYGGTGSSTLTIAHLDGTTVTTVNGTGGPGSVTSVAWAPDGQHVAYTVCPTGSGSCQVELSSLDGTTTTTVPAPAGVSPDRGISWGSQGLVVAGSYTAVTGCSGCPAGLYLLDPTGRTAPVQVVTPGGSTPEIGHPAASSTGALAYVGGPVSGPSQVLWSRPGSAPATVRGVYQGPAWSPDGSTLLFTNGYQVLEDNVAGGTPQAIATFGAYGISSLSWVVGGSSGSACSVALPAGSVRGISAAPGGAGYWVTDAYGAVSACGSALDFGGLSAIRLNQPVLGVAGTPDGAGYWLVAYDGGVFSFGDAAPASLTGAPAGTISLAGIHLAAPIWALAPTKTGKGYWLASTDGGVFTFGDAAFYGAANPFKPAAPVVGMAVSPTGRGYWLATADGSVYAFGDAGSPRLGAAGGDPIVGIATDPALPHAYWLVSAGGTVTGFGGAPALGSVASVANGAPVRGMAATPDGRGYWVVDADGTVSAFGDAVSGGNAN